MKKMSLAALALVLVTVTTAFTSQRNGEEVKAATEYAYFRYDLTTTSGEDDPDNWTKLPGLSTENCNADEGVFCVIQAPLAEDGIHPDFTGISDLRSSSMITSKYYKQ